MIYIGYKIKYKLIMKNKTNILQPLIYEIQSLNTK
jgi:hypothetical protein